MIRRAPRFISLFLWILLPSFDFEQRHKQYCHSFASVSLHADIGFGLIKLSEHRPASMNERRRQSISEVTFIFPFNSELSVFCRSFVASSSPALGAYSIHRQRPCAAAILKKICITIVCRLWYLSEAKANNIRERI